VTAERTLEEAHADGLLDRLDPPADFNFAHFRMRHMAAELLRTYRRTGIPLGAPAPAVDLEATDGSRCRLAALRGRPVLLHFVSYTCPLTRGAASLMRELHAEYGDRVQFVDIVVRQAHPGERRGPYRCITEKRSDARRYREEEGVSWLVLVDEIEGTVQRAFGGMSAALYLLDVDGRVAFYSMWGPAPRLRAAIEELLAAGGRTGPTGMGIDALPHLGAAIVAGQGGPRRGGLRSFVDLELGFPGGLCLMAVGRVGRRVLAPLFVRTTPLPRSLRLGIAGGAGAVGAALAVSRLGRRAGGGPRRARRCGRG
jgi:thiol-disulfide isomerase/thioredoxin